jgi:hypothetical protein
MLSLEHQVTSHFARSIRFTKSLSFLIAPAITGSAALAQSATANNGALCANDQAAIARLSMTVVEGPLWDNARIARAQSSLAKLQASRVALIKLTRRLNGAEQSAANAAAFDKSAESNFWGRDAADVRAAIDTEKKEGKVTCSRRWSQLPRMYFLGSHFQG